MHKTPIRISIFLVILIQLACRTAEAEPIETPNTVSSPAIPATTTLPTAETPTSNLPDWTVMLYLDADDDVLEGDITFDLNEAEMVGSTTRIQIVAQLDRYQGSYEGDGGWHNTRRYLITQDSDLTALNSPVVDDIGEADMGDPQTLADFIIWAATTYPAQKYALVLSDHGSGWLGGWTDPDPVPQSKLFLIEIVQALQLAQASGAFSQLELIGFDACLMSQMEVYAAIQPYARYAVASQEVEPALGWAYVSWLQALTSDPAMTGEQLGQVIVNSYIVEDQLVLNESARAAKFGETDTATLLNQLGSDITLSAVDLQKFPQLLPALDNLTAAMVNLDQATVAKARTYTQSYTTVFEQGEPSPYIDLRHFARVLYDLTGDQAVLQALNQLEGAIQDALIAEKHGTARPGAGGFTIHFPISRQYSHPGYGAELYVLATEQFTKNSNWDEFLAYHYTGVPFNPIPDQSFVPPSSATVTGPGIAQIELLPIEISADRITSGESIFVTSQVQGNNIAYIFTFVGYYEPETNAVLVADMDFYFTPETREVNGIYYPYFGDNEPFPLEWEWGGNIFNMSDGNISTFALFEPEYYGAPDEAAVYAVYGTYTYANGNPPDPAVIYFADFGNGGEAFEAYAFTGDGSTSAPWEIVPQTGDQFTVQYTIYTQDENGQVLISYQEGDTFTIGQSGLFWEAVPAPSGTYVIGFIVLDFDGNAYYQVAPIQIE